MRGQRGVPGVLYICGGGVFASPVYDAGVQPVLRPAGHRDNKQEYQAWWWPGVLVAWRVVGCLLGCWCIHWMCAIVGCAPCLQRFALARLPHSALCPHPTPPRPQPSPALPARGCCRAAFGFVSVGWHWQGRLEGEERQPGGPWVGGDAPCRRHADIVPACSLHAPKRRLRWCEGLVPCLRGSSTCRNEAVYCAVVVMLSH